MFGLSDRVIAQVSDTREAPRIPTGAFVRAGPAMFWLRIGSLNGLAGSADSPFWKKWLGIELPSAKSLSLPKLVDFAGEHDTLDESLQHSPSTPERDPAWESITLAI